MDKQKILIFSLSAMLFLTASFLVYSWSEPTTNMPVSYTIPINTSGTAQTKTGEFGASSFVDADNSNYYLNPSGNSIVEGTITADRPTETNNLATKGYVDEVTAAVEAIVTGAQPLVNGVHSQDDCTAAGGALADSDVSYKMCRFNSATCPSAWTAYKNYRTVGIQVSTNVSTSWFSKYVCDYYNFGSSSCPDAGNSSRTCWCNIVFSTLAWGNNSYRCGYCVCDCNNCRACVSSQTETTSTNTQIGCY